MKAMYFRVLNRKTQEWENKPLRSLTPDQINIVMANKSKEFLISVIRHLVESRKAREIEPGQIDTGTFDGFGYI